MRRTALTLLLAMGALACASEAPRTFRADSPANAAAAPAKRLPVATVLTPKDPLEASLCAAGAPCVLPAPPSQEPAEPSAHAGHHHHHP